MGRPIKPRHFLFGYERPALCFRMVSPKTARSKIQVFRFGTPPPTHPFSFPHTALRGVLQQCFGQMGQSTTCFPTNRHQTRPKVPGNRHDTPGQSPMQEPRK